MVMPFKAMLMVALAGVFLTAEAASVSGTQLTTVETTPDLNSRINHGGQQQIYGGTAYGTFVAVSNGGGQNTWPLFGPAFIPAGGSATSSAGYVAWTAGSQTVSGTGTAADPYVITTSDVQAGSSGISVSQKDSLIAANDFYRTDVTVTNAGATDQTIILYRAMDCYLGANDSGFGMIGGNTVGCIRRDTATNPTNTSDPTQPISRVEQFMDLSGGARKEVNSYSAIWSAIGTRREYGDACVPSCDTYRDNGMGMSWKVTIPAGASQTFSHYTLFSPIGRFPLTTAATASPATSPQGGTVAYTITLANPNPAAVQAQTVSFVLPAGFSFVPGSSSSAFPQPTASGNTLTWTGLVPVPGNDGSITIAFSANIGGTVDPGTYTSDVSGTANDGYTVMETKAAAAVEVTAVPLVPLTTAATASPATSPQGGTVAYTITVANPNINAAQVQTVSFVLPAGFSFVPDSSSGAFPQPTASGSTLTWTGPVPVPQNDGSITITFQASIGNTVAAGTYTSDVSGTANDGYTVLDAKATAAVAVTATGGGNGGGNGGGGNGGGGNGGGGVKVTPVPATHPLALVLGSGAVCAFVIRRRRHGSVA